MFWLLHVSWKIKIKKKQKTFDRAQEGFCSLSLKDEYFNNPRGLADVNVLEKHVISLFY